MNRINTTKDKTKEYESHSLTSKWKKYFMIFILAFEDNNIIIRLHFLHIYR